jgi:hypothetical protein
MFARTGGAPLGLFVLGALHPFQGASSRRNPSCLGVPPEPFARVGFLGYEAGIRKPPLALWVDVPFAYGPLCSDT